MALQTFLELEDEEMKEIEMISKFSAGCKDDEQVVGKGHSAKGYKEQYAPYPPSDTFIRVEFVNKLFLNWFTTCCVVV